MSNVLYNIRLRADHSKTAIHNWQNASELVSHGFWEWADGGNGAKQFSKAKKEAKVVNTKPQGFDHLEAVEDDEAGDDDDDDNTPVAPTKPVVEQKPITVADVAKIEVPEPVNDPYVDMSRDELFAACDKVGLKPDKRLGTKNLITLLRDNAQGAK